MGKDRSLRGNRTPVIRCRKCGNSDVFVEVMSYESHLVNGCLDYLHLLAAEVGHYLCWECGSWVDAPGISNDEPEHDSARGP